MTKTWDLILTGTEGRLGYDDGNGQGDGIANGKGDGTGDGGGDSTGDGSGYGSCGWSTGLKSCGHLLASSDSLAWSLNARLNEPLPECAGKHKKCTNCMRYALQWREGLLASTDRRNAA